MSETKACNLTEYEIKRMIKNHCEAIFTCIEAEADFSDGIERINYLNRRLKEFNKPADQSTQQQAAVNAPEVKGWG